LPNIETREEITFRVFDAGSKTEFTNNSLNSPKIGKLNNDTKIIPQGLLIHEKNPDQKSHTTVPFMHIELFFNFSSVWLRLYIYVHVHCTMCTYVPKEEQMPRFKHTLCRQLIKQ